MDPLLLGQAISLLVFLLILMSVVPVQLLCLVHLVGFIIRKFVTTHGHMNVKKSEVLTEDNPVKHAYRIIVTPCYCFKTRYMFRSERAIIRLHINLKMHTKYR